MVKIIFLPPFLWHMKLFFEYYLKYFEKDVELFFNYFPIGNFLEKYFYINVNNEMFVGENIQKTNAFFYILFSVPHKERIFTNVEFLKLHTKISIKKI